MRVMGLEFAGRNVLVAGAGTVATRRVRGLVGDGARVHVVAPVVSLEIEAWAAARMLELSRRPVRAEDLDGTWLVVAATDNSGVNDEISRWANSRQVWCVNASHASGGSARQAATSTHGDIAVGVVSLESPDPSRIRGVRDALAAHINTGGVDLRRTREHGPRVILVGSGPGAPDLMTLRGRLALAEADVVVTDRLGATSVLDELATDVEVVDVGKTPGNHPVPQDQINRIIIEKALEGKTVVRLKGGDPFIFGRGGEEVNACLAAGVPVEVVPGITSALSVPALAGIPVTQRAVAPGVIITTGHAGAEPAALAAMASGVTAVFLMAVSMLTEIADAALAAGVAPGTPVAIIENGSTPSERVTRGQLSTIAGLASEAGVQPPAVIVVGAVAGEGFVESHACAT